MRLTEDQWRDIAESFDEKNDHDHDDDPDSLNYLGLCHAAEKFSSNDVNRLSESMGYIKSRCWEYDHHLSMEQADGYKNFALPRVMFALLMAELCERGEYEGLFNNPKEE